MSRNRRSWIVGILFWLLFLISIALSDRYRWLNTAWVFGGVLFAAVASVLVIVEVFRSRDGSGEYLYYRAVPRFVRWLLMDDEQLAKDLEQESYGI